MKKEAFWFTHDSNAKDDPKCALMIEQMGVESYGMFWILVEFLRDQPGYKYPLILVPAIARRYNMSSEKILAIISKYGLFQVEGNEFFYSNSLIDRMKPLETKREQARLAGIQSGISRQLNGRSTGVQRMLNSSSTNIEHNITEKNITEKNITEKNVCSEKRVRFSIPTLEIVTSFFLTEKGLNDEDSKYRASRFIDFYESKNWMVGKNKMTNWKTAATRSLEWEDKRLKPETNSKPKIGYNYIDEEQLMKDIMKMDTREPDYKPF